MTALAYIAYRDGKFQLQNCIGDLYGRSRMLTTAELTQWLETTICKVVWIKNAEVIYQEAKR